jgi:Domain of unknown function (DUF4806)
MDGIEGNFKQLYTLVFADSILNEYNWSGRGKKAMLNLKIIWSIMYRKEFLQDNIHICMSFLNPQLSTDNKIPML